MTLTIERITLQRFRSYEELHLDDIGELTIFFGANAVGKTNIIEGIQLLTALCSFRNSKSSELIKKGHETGRAVVDVTDGNRHLEIALTLEERKRTYLLNGKKKRTRDLKGLVPSVIFTPDELTLIKGSNAGRRAELDSIGTQLNTNYYQILKDFEKILRHKNKLLKDEAPAELVDAINEMFAKVGEQLTNYRHALFERLMPYIVDAYKEIAGGNEVLSGSYIESWEGDLSEALAYLRENELTRKRTLVGPHLDSVLFMIDGMDASVYASQGQQRSIVLALKLAEAQLVEDMLDQLPILLLDDVMSELDGSRRDALVSSLMRGKQTFITTANINYFDQRVIDAAQIIEIEKQ